MLLNIPFPGVFMVVRDMDEPFHCRELFSPFNDSLLHYTPVPRPAGPD